MSRVYALLQPDGSLLAARQKGSAWKLVPIGQGVEANGKNLTVFLNGLDVLGVSAVIPARNENEARKAAPFAIEDDIADAIEASHVALAAPNKDDPSLPRQINVASIDRLTDICKHLSDIGYGEAALVAAHSVLPNKDILFEAPGLVLGRLGPRTFAADASLGRDVMISLLEAHPETAVHGEHIAAAVGRSSSAPGADSLEALLLQLAIWADGGNQGIDLKQGAFKARRSVDFDGFGRWKVAGALAAVVALSWFGSAILETNAMNNRSAELDALSEEFARVGWPETNGDVQQVLAISGSDRSDGVQVFPSVLDATAVLYDALAQVEGTELRSIRYDRLRRQMTATIAFESFADVDRLTAVVNATGLQARSGDSRQSGSKVVGDLTLENAS
ncbi:MAG: type II secretion system protein GspL [Henriciella sp.]